MKNLKWTFSFFWLIVSYCPLFGQMPLMKSEVKTIELSIQQEGNNRKVNYSPKIHNKRAVNFLQIDKIEMEDSDLIINYQLLQKIENSEVEIAIQLIDGNGMTITPQSEDLGQLTSTKETIIWKNFLESDVSFDESYSLIIHTNLFGTICANPPTFDLKQKLPYYGGATIGIVSLAIGQVYKNQSDREEADYRLAWAEGRTANLDKAESDFNKYKVLTYVGLGVLGVDAILYFFRQRKHKNAVKEFEKFCAGEKKSSVNLGLNQFNQPEVGWRLKF